MAGKGRHHRRYQADEIAAALRSSQGLVTVAAASLGCAPGTIYNAIKKYATVRQALKDAREAMLDRAEARLFQKIDTGDNTAIMFYLKTIGKHRGYVERQETTGADGGPVELRVKGYVSVSPDDWPEGDDADRSDR